MYKPLAVWCVLFVTCGLPGILCAADYGEYLASVDQAIQAGDAVKAIDLMCDWTEAGSPVEFSKTHGDEMLAALGRWRAFQHQRYLEVFRPPAPVESYFQSGLGVSWENWGVASAFGRVRSTAVGQEYDDGLLLLSDSLATIVVDLDRDGDPEMTYDGETPHFNASVTAAHDDARDGQRQQWLAAAAGADPRTEAMIWLYRDGPVVSIIVKGADGALCGRSWCLGRGL